MEIATNHKLNVTAGADAGFGVLAGARGSTVRPTENTEWLLAVRRMR